MATNGICSITVKGKEYPLYFNIQAIEEFSNRIFANPSRSPFKTMVDQIYSGLSGYAAANDLKYPTYPDVYSLCEEFNEEEDSAEQYARIDECYSNSKWGKKQLEDIEDFKKKAMEIMTKDIGTTSENTV